MDELSIDAPTLGKLIFYVRALMAREETDVADTGGNATDDEIPEVLQEKSDDMLRDELRSEIEGLNDDQQHELVALMWIGRGDSEPEEWDNLLGLAAEREDGPTVDYLLAQPLLADYWAEGLDKLGHGSAVQWSGEY